MNLGAVPFENLRYRSHAPNAAGGSPITVDNAGQSHCCHRRCRGPLISRLGKFIYSRAQEKHHERQLRGAQEQGYIDPRSAEIDTKASSPTLEMPPDYDAAMRKEGVWFDEKKI